MPGAVAGQFVDESAVLAAAEEANERLDAGIVLHASCKTEVERVLPNRQEVET